MGYRLRLASSSHQYLLPRRNPNSGTRRFEHPRLCSSTMARNIDHVGRNDPLLRCQCVRHQSPASDSTFRRHNAYNILYRLSRPTCPPLPTQYSQIRLYRAPE
jgi:hypothetical protein